MRSNPETILQIQIANFLRLALPPDVVWSAFPAGGGGKIRGGQLKAMGLAPGMGDILVIVPPHARCCFIEIKAPAGRPSTEQIHQQAAVRNSGGVYEFCYSIGDVISVLKAAGCPLRQVAVSPLGPAHTGFQRRRVAKKRLSAKRLALGRAAGFGRPL